MDRQSISNKYKWKLEDMYSNNELWEKDLELVKNKYVVIEKFRGKLAESASNIYECLEFEDNLSVIIARVFVYARMRRDEDNSNPQYQAFVEKATSLMNEVHSKFSFITPELVNIDRETINKYMEEFPKLKLYDRFFQELYRQREYVLSEREEEILAMSAEALEGADNIFMMLNNADMTYGSIVDENGDTVEVTKGNYSVFMESKDRRVRKDAFDTLYQTYIDHKNTLATTLVTNVKTNEFYSKVRGYDSPLHSSLDSDNIKVELYDNLIDAVSDNLGLLHRYVALRKKILGLDEIHMYDLYVPIVDQFEKEIEYEEATEIVKEAVKPLGEKYVDDLTNAFDSGWIDVYENTGKTSGAYSWGCYLSHPYVLLNYQGKLGDVFTLAHEMGHALHSFYTNKAQPHIYSNYKIFVAEVASTVNENLLVHHLKEQSADKTERAYLLNKFLEEFRGTIFRQVMFAEFEKIIHNLNSAGEPLTCERLCEIYRELNIKYYGNDIVVDENIDYEWSRIPHFYSSFYVYKYATGFASAIAFADKIQKGEGVEEYLNFLSSGSSDYPLELLKKAGVDLCSPKPVEDAMKAFENALDEFEKIME